MRFFQITHICSKLKDKNLLLFAVITKVLVVFMNFFNFVY